MVSITYNTKKKKKSKNVTRPIPLVTYLKRVLAPKAGIKVSSPTRGINVISLLFFCVLFCDGTVLATSRYPVKGSYHISINEPL
jgi:hypothetical protein